MIEKEITLSIEASLQGGSISLLQGSKEIDYWIGVKEVSKSEDILDEIKNLFNKNNLKKDEIKRIVVSKGPGSITGIRIGMAIGIGLRKAFDCRLVRVSILEAMLATCRLQRFDSKDESISAVPFGLNQIYWKSDKLQSRKNVNNELNPQLSTIENFSDFITDVKLQNKREVFMHRKLYLYYRANFEYVSHPNIIITDAGENIAVINALANLRQKIKN